MTINYCIDEKIDHSIRIWHKKLLLPSIYIVIGFIESLDLFQLYLSCSIELLVAY